MDYESHDGEVVSVRDVGHRFGSTWALGSVSMDLARGVTGLLGPNGSGKTTLLSLLATERVPSRGDVLINGGNTRDRAPRSSARALIGYLPQRFELMPGVRARDNVEYAAWAHGVREADVAAATTRALQAVGLQDRARSRVRSLSGGMRQRLGIACAIAHDPRVLLLDEPTVGLDPAQRVQIRRYLDRIAERTTVVVSTHLLEDLRSMASRVMVLVEGGLVFDGTVATMEDLGRQADPSNSSGLEAAYESLVLSATEAS